MVRRYRAWAAAGLALLGVVIFLAGRQMLPGLVERALTQAIWAEGLTGAQVTLTDLAADQASGTLLLDTRCAPACRTRFTAGYSLAGLWGRRLDMLLISDLSLSGWVPPPLLSPGPDRWLWPAIQVRDVALPLPDNPLIPVSLQVAEATLTPVPGGGWRGVGQGRLSAGGVALAGLAMQGTLLPGQPPDLQVTATPAGNGPQADGTLRVRFPAGGLLPVGEGSLKLDNLALWGLSPLRLELSARSGADGALLLNGVLDLPTGPTASGSLRAGRISVSLTGSTTRLEGQVSAAGIGIQDGPPDNRADLPLLLTQGPQGWRVESPTGGSLFLPALGVAAHGLALTAPAEGGNMVLSADSLHLGGPAPLLVPLRPQLRLEREGEKGQWLAYLSAPDLDGHPLLRGEAAWQAGGESRLLLEIPPQTLAPAGRSLADLSPWLARWLNEAKGRVGLRLTYAQNAAGITSAAHLLLDQAGFAWHGGRVEGLSGVLWFDRLSPLAMSPQTLWLGRLRAAGMVLDGGAVTVELPGDGHLDVGPAVFSWSGLSLQLAPSRFDMGKAPPPLALTLPASPVGTVLAVLGLTPLMAEGTIRGHIDLPLDGQSLPLGGLQADGAGRIAWQGGETVPAFLDPQRTDSPALVAAALRHYQFQELRLTPDADGPVLRLEGANPDLYGGFAMGLTLHIRPRIAATPRSRPPTIDAAVTAYTEGQGP